MSNESYLLVSGCSHTSGVGIDKKYIWAQQVAYSLDFELINLAQEGACAKFVSLSLIDWFKSHTDFPELVIAQWPNPYRSMKLINQQIKFYNVNAMDKEFEQRIKIDPDGFVKEWYDSIVEFNLFCPTKVINICLESDKKIKVDLANQGITLYIDEKRPGKSWQFDSGATDGFHHSPQCHQKWAERVLTIYNNSL